MERTRLGNRPPRATPASGRIALGWLVLTLLVAGGIALAAGRMRWGQGSEPASKGAPVQRGPLRIAVTASGSLSAADTVRLSSGVEGRTTILSIAPEGSQVHEGDVVCELDATVMEEKRIQQSITVSNAEAQYVKAKQTLEIQESQNRSDIQKAQQVIEFANQDLQMFLEGERNLELENAQQAIELAQEEAQRARNQYTWSETLSAKKFLTTTELEADRIAVHRAEVTLKQATSTREILERYRMPRREAELRGAVTEARQEGERVQLQAKARLVDFEANVHTSEATLGLEQQKLGRLDVQVEKAKMRAPRDGYVVYAQRDRDEPPIQAGAEVREREEILSIPSSDGMIAEVKLHESVLKQVRVGQECSLTIDALPGVSATGHIRFVAMLPDQNSRWANPNLRVYRAEVVITPPNPAMRPGMSCAVEILVDELADAIYVPIQSVFRDASGNVSFVSGRRGIERRPVRVGRSTELWAQILEGLQPGEIVSMSPPPGFNAQAVAPEAEAERDAENESAPKPRAKAKE